MAVDPRALLLAQLQGGGPPPDAGGGPPPDAGAAPPDGGGPPGGTLPDTADPLQALQQVIQDLHTLISVLPDPKATAVASQCLAALTKVQTDMMGQGAGAGGGPPGGGGGPTAGGRTGAGF